MISLQNLVRKVNEAIGPGISQIIFTLVLCDLTLENGSLQGENKGKDISYLILDILAYIFDNLKMFIVNLNDDFEAILNMFISLSKKNELDISQYESEAQRLEMKANESMLEKSNLYAPSSGMLGKLNIEEGENVTQNTLVGEQMPFL